VAGESFGTLSLWERHRCHIGETSNDYCDSDRRRVGADLFAVRNREFRKFLAGAFFVSGGIQFYLYLAGVSVPFLGTGFVQTPELSRTRSIVHMVLFAITFYFGFVKRPASHPE
jgi:hypothetical protein